MPLYEYECSKCHERFEVLQKFSDEPVQACIHCGGPVDPLFSSSSIRFKGTGWYITDYARKSSPGSASGDDGKGKEDQKPATASEETKETKTDETPAKSAPSPNKEKE